ncbi:MAG: hypothetical protein COY80_04120 [Candidatus Pacebacteria bacterium CG_4_10_14_0_8_um_filter_42_14]|nr:MAG: hypothetical protein COY80_04120 [Candidatus Pacebacteria bacterium CG_4_10_14_0_8_um_filter_42_14]
MKYVIAVDGGGTKTNVLCADENGTVVGTGLSGPTNLTSTSVGAASFNLREVIRQATQALPPETTYDQLVMGLAGMDSEEERQLAENMFSEVFSQFSVTNFTLVNDAIIALENGSDQPNAIIIISGTGSNCYGKNSAGITARTGGMDFLLTDQGSGYAIGRQVLREAVKSHDGRRSKSILEEMVLQHFKITSISQLKHKVYNPLLSKVEIGGLARICTAAYAQNDQAAHEIIHKAVADLFLMLKTLIEKLELEDQNFDCIFAGAVVQLPVIKDPLVEELTRTYSGLNLVFPENPPVNGALKMALAKLRQQ